MKNNMKVLTFTGSTPAEALKNAKAQIGDDGLLIDTKKVRAKDLSRDGLYEAIIAVDKSTYEKYVNKKAKEKEEPKEQKTILKESEDVLFDISNAAKEISKVSDIVNQTRKSSLYDLNKIKEPVVSKNNTLSEPPKELKEIKKEINKLGDNIKLMQNMLWSEKSPTEIDIPLPPEFAEIYRLSSKSGMKLEHLNEIMRLTLEHMPAKMKENSITVRRYFQTILRKMIPIRVETTPMPGSKKVMMLVGPTGVGKTTSIAKLAARYSFLMQKKYKVGLVVLDTYRIGAVEQLMQYARMMKLSIETVVDPPEFSMALNSLSHCDYILIDTMGSSPYDKSKIEKIYECLSSNSTNLQIDVTLVLPTSIKYEDLRVTYDNFETLGIDNMMFTKLDETIGFGNVFSLAYETRKPISYFSVGQEVPEDLVCASSDFLVDCLLNGFNRSKAL